MLNFRIHTLNVGQADAQLVTVCQDNNTINILIDCGKTIGHGDRIATIIDNNKIEYLIVTHADLDHWGGLKSRELYKRIIDKKIPIICVNAGNAKYHSDNVIWQYLKGNSVLGNYYESGIKITKNCFLSFHAANDNSASIKKLNDWQPKLALGEIKDTPKNLSSIACLFVVHDNSYNELFTYYTAGDLPSTHEDKLVGDDLFKIDVMKLSHHGSRGSTSEKFVNSTIPALAYISHGNGHGHPNIEPLYYLINNRKNKYVSIIQTNLITKGDINQKTPYFTPLFNQNNGDIITWLKIDDNWNKELLIAKDSISDYCILYSAPNKRFESSYILHSHSNYLGYPCVKSHFDKINKTLNFNVQDFIIREINNCLEECDLELQQINNCTHPDFVNKKEEYLKLRDKLKKQNKEEWTNDDIIKCAEFSEYFEEVSDMIL